MHQFVVQGGYALISLPHARGQADIGKQALPPKICKLERELNNSIWPAPLQGIEEARIYPWVQFEAFARRAARHRGIFAEFWLTKRKCDAA